MAFSQSKELFCSRCPSFAIGGVRVLRVEHGGAVAAASNVSGGVQVLLSIGVKRCPAVAIFGVSDGPIVVGTSQGTLLLHGGGEEGRHEGRREEEGRSSNTTTTINTTHP